jgi:hypothetical protein
MLVTCVSATDETFCTCGDVLLLLYGATSTAAVGSTFDIEAAGRAARRASAMAESIIGQPLGLQVYSETLAAAGDLSLVVSRTPIVRVLRLFDSTATSEATEFCSTDYRVEDAAAGILSRDRGFTWTAQRSLRETPFSLGLEPAYLPGRDERPWLVEYVAGYRIAGSTVTCMGVCFAHDAYTTQATLPDDLVQAVAAQAAYQQGNPLGVTSRRVGDLAVEYGSAGPAGSGAPAGVAPATWATLSRYQRLV